jgi:taurine dioxygenase
MKASGGLIVWFGILREPWLLDIFFAHITKPEHLTRHHWSAGDVVMWDNRSTAHYADNDYGSFRRVMHRITLKGDIPVGPSSR